MTKCVSPWYNHTGWLGVKHQFTYLPVSLFVLATAGRANVLTNDDGNEVWST